MATNENWFSRRKGKPSGDLFKLDIQNKTPEQNIVEIIQGLYVKKSPKNEPSPTNKPVALDFRPGLRYAHRNNSDSGRLSYLNALVTLLSNENTLGFTTDELMLCIRVNLVDESMVIRATALRVLRYLINTENDVAIFNNLKLSYLVMRSMDLMLRNEEERTQALRVVRRIIAVVGNIGKTRRHRAAYIDQGLLRCMAAVARAGSGGDGSSDRLAKPAVATLAEICVLNPELFIMCGGVNAVLRQLAECATPRMAEALCGVLLHTLNDPVYRNVARIDLTCLGAPYCDFHLRPAGTVSTRDDHEVMRFTCSRLALLCVLRSWPGLLHFCHPYTTGGLRALVRALYLPRLEVRKAILDLLYELVGLPQSEWTDELSVALNAVDPSDFQDSWRLNEGFVAAEGIAILPHLSAIGPDITEMHLALLLQCFLEAGLLDGLAEVIVTGDTHISVRATILLGQLLHLIHLFLPPQICSVTPALPSLMCQAAAGKPQALAAVAALRKLHNMFEARPATNSLFLDHIIQYCSGAFREKDEDTTKSRKEKDNANMAKPKEVLSNFHRDSIEFLNESDNENEPKQRHSIGSRADIQSRNINALVKSKSVSSRTSAAVSKMTKSAKFFNLFERESDSLIRCSLVLQNKDGKTWNWEIIRTILKENGSPLLNLNDSGHKAWAARIINYLKPSANKYSHTELSSTCYGHSATRAGCQLIRHLLAHNDADTQRLLEGLFYDVSHQIEAIETGRKAHECLFSPQHMCNTMCQMYFLFIGQLCHTYNGLKLFKQTKLYENLLELSTKTHHSCYVKLVISSLDYTLDSYPRDILAKTLTCNIIPSRTYATQFLNVLLRASKKSRELIRRKSKKKGLINENMKPSRTDDNSVDMDTWILQMLIGQLKDESKAVIKCALSILEEAYSVNSFLEKMIPMRDLLAQNSRFDKDADPSTYDLSIVGDRGYLIWLGLEVAASAQNPEANTFIKRHLDYWTKTYNYRYVRLVECTAHCALTASGRERGGSRRARPPPHLHAALAHYAPSVHHHHHHHKILQRKKCTNEQEVADLKASLWAIGHSCVTSQGLQQVMSLTNGYLEDSVPVHVVRLAKYCSVYAVRATAFYVLGLIGSTYDGANLLSDLGWYCVRHTRHDQFPVIPDETHQSMYDSSGNINSFITSPDRRYNAYDTEISEHSDHTDQSIVESLQSDYVKHLNKTIGSVAESCAEEKDQDVVDHKINSIEKKESDKRKSHTLPTQGCSTAHERPTLSESRTVDILRDYSNLERNGTRNEHRILSSRLNSLDHGHEGRVRNTSESSTSGVSSCDSFLGRYTVPDRVVLTLSPIPSSSSLYGMKGSSSSHRPKLCESIRRTSTSSFTTPDVASSPPSQLDMTGYETLKSIYKNRRPHLSESAASSSEMDDLSWLLTDTHKKSNKPFSSLRERTKSSRERRSKMSVLDYDWRPLPLAVPGGAAPPPPPARRPPPPAPPHHHQYIGICLPKDLMDLFPRDPDGKEMEQFMKEQPRRRAPSFLLDSSTASTDNKSRATPDSQNFSSYRGTDVTSSSGVGHRIPNVSNKHSTPINLKSNIEDKRIDMTDIVAGMAAMTTSIEASDHTIKHREQKAKTDNETNADGKEKDDKKNETNERDSESGANSSKANAVNVNTIGKWRHVSADCLACVRTRPPSAHELREAFFGGNLTTSPPTMESSESSAHSPQAQLLFHASHMSNPIHLKQTRSALLTLKQRHPEVFRSPCVYSDVCALLSRDTYMLCARRFLHELFLDTSFACFAGEPLALLARHVTTQKMDV